MRDDALPFRRIAALAGAIAGAVVLAAAVALGLPHLRSLPSGGAPVAPPAAPADQPALESAPQPELAAYRLEKQRALDGLGWVDAARGEAHVPIALAMALRVRAAASETAR
jgi:hypothetical protein